MSVSHICDDLHEAAKQLDLDCAEKILSHSSLPAKSLKEILSANDECGWTPLDVACYQLQALSAEEPDQYIQGLDLVRLILVEAKQCGILDGLTSTALIICYKREKTDYTLEYMLLGCQDRGYPISCNPFLVAVDNLDSYLIRLLKLGYGKLFVRFAFEIFERRLFSLIEEGDFTRTQFVLEMLDYPCTDSRNEFGQTYLHVACAKDRRDIVKLILSHSVVLNPNNIRDKQNDTPLHTALRNRSMLAVKELLDANGLDPTDSASPLDMAGLQDSFQKKKSLIKNICSAVSAGHVKWTKLLLDMIKHPSMNWKNEEGTTFLHIACSIGRLDMVELILSADIMQDLKVRNGNGESPLDIARKCGSEEMVMVLLAKTDPNSDELKKHLFALVAKGDVEKICPILEQLDYYSIDGRNEEGRTLLHVACAKDHHEMVKLLLTRALMKDLNSVDQNGDTALHVSLGGKRILSTKELLAAKRAEFIDGTKEERQRWKTRNIDFMAVTKEGNSPLHLVVKIGNVQLLKAFLSLEVNLKNLFDFNLAGKTPIEGSPNKYITHELIHHERFLPSQNVQLEHGSHLLHELCSCDHVDYFIFNKTDSLFLKGKPRVWKDGDELEAMKAADDKKKHNIVWLFLRAGPIDIKLDEIEFFKALEEGRESDRYIFKKKKETFMHVFARTGFARAIRYAQTSSATASAGSGICQATYFHKNTDDNFPSMEAAKHNQREALLLLLRPLYDHVLMLDDLDLEAATAVIKDVNMLIHTSNKCQQTLVSMVGHHRRNLFLAHSILSHFEALVHENNSVELQRCLRNALGSTNKSKTAVGVVKKGTVQTSNTTKYRKCIQIFFLSFMIPLFMFLLDWISDVYLIYQYHSDAVTKSTNTTIVTTCQDTLTLKCFSAVPDTWFKFGMSLAFVLLPFCFYLFEMVHYYRMKEEKSEPVVEGSLEGIIARCNRFLQSVNTCHWVIAIPFSAIQYLLVCLFWPVRAFFFNFRNQYRTAMCQTHTKLDRHVFKENACRVYSARAHLIEVCLESSFMPLLQLYLFLPTLIRIGALATVTLQELATLQTVQYLSVFGSVLSLSFSFTCYSMSKKQSAFHWCVFLSNLCFVTSRLFAFEVFAYYFGPFQIWVPFLYVIAHVMLMSLVHWSLEAICCKTEEHHFPAPTESFKIIYNCLLNGLANIYVHNKVDIQRRHRRVRTSCNQCGRRSTRYEPVLDNGGNNSSTFKRQLAFDSIFLAEIVAMVTTGHFAQVVKDDSEYAAALNVITAVIFVLFFVGLILKIAYYRLLHIWSDLIGERMDKSLGKFWDKLCGTTEDALDAAKTKPVEVCHSCGLVTENHEMEILM